MFPYIPEFNVIQLGDGVTGIGGYVTVTEFDGFEMSVGEFTL